MRSSLNLARLLVLVAWAAVVAMPASSANAIDRVRLRSGTQATGTIASTTPTHVVVALGETRREHPINEIESVTFDGEPNELTQARIAVAASRYADALAMLARIKPESVQRKLIAEDVEFYKAIATGRAALAGAGEIAAAGRQLVAFERAHRNSFHYLEACETLGDLLLAAGRPEQAETFYSKLAAAPWPDYKLRAAVLVGNALAAQKAYDQAIARFDEVIGAPAGAAEVEAQRMSARLGKAAAQSGAGQHDTAITTIEEIIAAAKPEEEVLLARAYNALGQCQQAASRPNEALLAFLHVDLLFARAAQEHAEALAHLVALWTELDQPERAEQARAMLEEQYPSSAWAKQ